MLSKKGPTWEAREKRQQMNSKTQVTISPISKPNQKYPFCVDTV